MIIIAALAQIIAACFYCSWASKYYSADRDLATNFLLHWFHHTPNGERRWSFFATISVMFLSSVVQCVIVVICSKPDLPIHPQMSSTDIKAEREALLEKWERLQKRSWELDREQHRKEMDGYLKADVAEKSFLHTEAADNFVNKEEAQKHLVTKEEFDVAISRV